MKSAPGKATLSMGSMASYARLATGSTNPDLTRRGHDRRAGPGRVAELIGLADAAHAIQPWDIGTLHVLACGQVPPNPSELLGSRTMETLLEQLSTQYDIVLIDTPALLPVTDAVILAKVTGGALMVAGAGILHRQQLADGLGSLQDVGARVLVVVLNRLADKQDNSYWHYEHAAGPVTWTRTKQTGAGTSGPTQKVIVPVSGFEGVSSLGLIGGSCSLNDRSRRLSREAQPGIPNLLHAHRCSRAVVAVDDFPSVGQGPYVLNGEVDDRRPIAQED